MRSIIGVPLLPCCATNYRGGFLLGRRVRSVSAFAEERAFPRIHLLTPTPEDVQLSRALDFYYHQRRPRRPVHAENSPPVWEFHTRSSTTIIIEGGPITSESNLMNAQRLIGRGYIYLTRKLMD